MNFRSILSTIKGLFPPKHNTTKYAVYAVVLLLVFSVVGVFLSRRIATELAELKEEAKDNARVSDIYQKELMDEISHLQALTDNTDRQLAVISGKEAIAQVAIQQLEEELEAEQKEIGSLQLRLTDAHQNIAGSQLKNSFLGERIVEELYNYFPDAETATTHLFFSETQANLFRTNPATANLIYTIITENAVRIQIIGSLTDQVTIITDLLEQSDTLVTFRGEEVFAYEVLVSEYDEVFNNLEAALSIERQMTTNLERQIKLMNRKNFFQRVLPSLNVVIGPYYDPFRNQVGFAVSLGLGWRF